MKVNIFTYAYAYEISFPHYK